MNINYFFDLVKAHGVQVTIIPWYEDPFTHNILGVKIIFSKHEHYQIKYVSETELSNGNEDFMKLIFEKNIHELEEFCKNDQT